MKLLIRSLPVLAPTVLLVLGGWKRLWLGDDGFINVRVAEQLLAGHGFVYNVGERVEAVTSPLWVFVLAGVGALGVRVEDAAMALGLAMSGAGMALSCAAARRWVAPREREPWFVPLGALAYAAVPAAWDYVTSGLENGLGLLWFGGSLLAVTRACGSFRSNRRLTWSALLVGLAPLVRPDYALLGAPLGLLLVLAADSWSHRARIALAGLSPGLGFQIFRMGYFAAITPNTALAKEAFEAQWTQGVHYLWNTLGTYWLLVPLACVVGALAIMLGTREKTARIGLAAAVGGLAHMAYVVRVGGDFMHARLLLPSLFALCSVVAVVPFRLTTRTNTWALRGLTLVTCAWAAVCAARLRIPAENEHGIGDERGWHARMAKHPNPYRLEHYQQFFFYTIALKKKREVERACPSYGGSRDEAPPCRRLAYWNGGNRHLSDRKEKLPLSSAAAPPSVIAVVATNPLGIAGLVHGLQVNVVDTYGLAEPFAARLVLSSRRRPGHEKSLKAHWFAARYGAEGATTDPRATAARRVLACSPIRDLDAAIREPMSLTRFVRNLFLALPLQALRVPEDPFLAERTLCAREPTSVASP